MFVFSMSCGTVLKSVDFTSRVCITCIPRNGDLVEHLSFFSLLQKIVHGFHPTLHTFAKYRDMRAPRYTRPVKTITPQ